MNNDGNFKSDGMLNAGRKMISNKKVFIKVVFFAAIPLLLMGVLIGFISVLEFTKVLEDEIKDELKTTAYGISDNYNYIAEGDYSKGEDGRIYKGDTVVSGKLTQMQIDIIRNGLVCTFFYGDERIDTSVVDDTGINMAGTKMGSEIASSIYGAGKEVFFDDINLGGRKYYGYYIPVYNSDGTVKACFFAGKLREDVTKSVHSITRMIIWVIVIVTIFGVIISAFLLINLINNLYERFEYEKEKSIKGAAGRIQEEFLVLVEREIRGALDEIAVTDERLLNIELSEEARNKALTIKDLSNEMTVAFSSINNYSKLESGRIDIEKRVYELKELLESAKKNIQASLERKKLKFSVEVAEGTPSFLRGDYVKIRQIIDNILVNAVKYTYEGGVRISVFARDIQPGIVDLSFTISDTGIGIREEDIDTLFTSFGKTGNVKGVGIKGTGLGLLICKRLVNLMDGRISVESEIGMGSTFKVAIPQEIVQK